MRVYCSEGRVEEAGNVMSKMKKGEVLSGEVLSDHAAYTLIDGYGNMECVNQAFSVLKQIIDGSCHPNYTSYSILLKHPYNRKQSVSGFIHAVDMLKLVELDIVDELLDEMNKNNCVPDAFTYNALISGYFRVERYEEDKLLFSRMKEGGLPHNENIYTPLINCSIMESGFTPNLESYRLLLFGLCNEGNFEKAKFVFSESLGMGCNNDEVAWEVLGEVRSELSEEEGCRLLILCFVYHLLE